MITSNNTYYKVKHLHDKQYLTLYVTNPNKSLSLEVDATHNFKRVIFLVR